LAFLFGDYTWMQNSIERREFGRVGEDQVSNFRAIHVAIGLKNSFSERGDNFVVSRLAGFCQIARNFVGVNYTAAEIAHHFRDGAFAAANSACESHAQH
jgi:hypothetical protein